MGYFWMLLSPNISALHPHRKQACHLAQAGLVPHTEQLSALISLSCCCALGLQYIECNAYKTTRQRQCLK